MKTTAWKAVALVTGCKPCSGQRPARGVPHQAGRSPAGLGGNAVCLSLGMFDAAEVGIRTGVRVPERYGSTGSSVARKKGETICTSRCL